MGKFAVLIALILSLSAEATKWEVAVLFLASSSQDPLYQKDIDHNIVELARSNPGPNYKLSLYREMPERGVSFFVNPQSATVQDGAPLFFEKPPIKFPVPGVLTNALPVSPPLLRKREPLKAFLHEAFSDPAATRLLVIFTHGFAFEGLEDLRLKDLKKVLSEALPKNRKQNQAPPLDALWLDSCFMANVESAYELKNLARYYISSEESEFSAGAPFETFQLLKDGPANTEETLLKFAEAYLTSYSLTKKGSQKDAVFGSSATLSVIDLQRLSPLVLGLQGLVNAMRPLSAEEQESIRRSLKRVDLKLQDRTQLLDLGGLLRHWDKRKLKLKSDEARARVESLLHLLELTNDGELQTNPRLRLEPPSPGARVVFGYSQWTQGMQGDERILLRLPPELTPKIGFEFVPGPNALNWPSRPVEKRLYVAPFLPGVTRFDYQFIQPNTPQRPLTEERHVLRTGLDYVIKRAKHSGNPILFSGYTQGVGKLGEKYHGLSILDPTEQTLPTSYSYLEFSEATRWEELLFSVP